VEGLLDFGRLQTGKVQFKLEPMDAAAFAREAAASFSQAHPGITHRLIVNALSPTCSVHADRDALQCALWNLLENAVKYSPASDVVHIDVEETRRFVTMAVRDEGIGIPREKQRRIFDRFTRGAAARERHIGGTGIGLTTAREIVRAHGGEIIVDSKPGRGSTFTIRLPSRVPAKARADDDRD
jgi:signal transduction histidine kinase